VLTATPTPPAPPTAAALTSLFAELLEAIARREFSRSADIRTRLGAAGIDLHWEMRLVVALQHPPGPPPPEYPDPQL
jgi:hypothetical protein